MYNAYEEIKARGAYILIITELTDLEISNESTHVIIVPKNYYQVVIFSVVLQFISYKLSLYNNNNPDKPKNLAKVVTVE